MTGNNPASSANTSGACGDMMVATRGRDTTMTGPHEQPPPYPVYQQPQPPAPQNDVGTAAMVCGILSLFFWPLALVSIPLGAVGASRVKHGRATNEGSAWAGIALGVLGLLFGGVVMSMLLA